MICASHFNITKDIKNKKFNFYFFHHLCEILQTRSHPRVQILSAVTTLENPVITEATKYMTATFNEHKLICTSNLNSFIMEIMQIEKSVHFAYF